MSVKLIAETAAHHEGDFTFFSGLIDKIMDSSADIVKLHVTQNLHEYMSEDHPAFSLVQGLIFSEDQWDSIFRRIMPNKQVMALVNDVQALELAVKYSPQYYEVHSVCLNDLNLLTAVRQNIEKSAKLVLGVGGSSLDEIEAALRFVAHKDVVLMFGFQNYPTKYGDVNFNKIRRIMQLFPGYEYGYADHTAWDHENNVLVTMFGAALGMQYVEKHVTTEPGFSRIDSSAAITFEKFEEIKLKLAVLNECNGTGALEFNAGEKKYSKFGQMKKAALLRRSVSKGELFSTADVDFKRTLKSTDLSQLGVAASEGLEFARDLSAGHVLTAADFSGS